MKKKRKTKMSNTVTPSYVQLFMQQLPEDFELQKPIVCGCSSISATERYLRGFALKEKRN